jgi:hypothetical protein
MAHGAAADDLFAVLIRDHRELRARFRLLESALRDGDLERIADHFCRLAERLFTHARCEERVLYPWLEATCAPLRNRIGEARRELHALDRQLEALGASSPEEPGWRAELGALGARLERYVALEEEELFGLAGAAVDAHELAVLGDRLAAVRRQLLEDLEELDARAPAHTEPSRPLPGGG